MITLPIDDLHETGPEARARTCHPLLIYALRHLRNLMLWSVSAGYTMFIGLRSNHAPLSNPSDLNLESSRARNIGSTPSAGSARAMPVTFWQYEGKSSPAGTRIVNL